MQRLLGIDRAIGFGVILKLWGLFSGPLIVYLITSRMTPVVQGTHYVFGSIVGLGAFFELGLGIVLAQFAAHEWSSLQLSNEGTITGDAKALGRLASLLRFGLRWYAWVALGFGASVAVFGLWFIGRGADGALHWRGPFLFLIAISTINLVMMPVLSVLEGCGQVGQMMKFRFIAAVTSTVGSAICLLSGKGLWVLGFSALASGNAVVILLWRSYRPMLTQLLQIRDGHTVSWRHELLPLQSKFAINVICGYALFAIYVPVVFNALGAAEAGRVGLALQLIGYVQAIGLLWVSTQTPGYGVLIAQRDFKELDRRFLRNSLRSVGLVLLGLIALMAVLVAMTRWSPAVGARMPSPPVMACFCFASLLNQCSQCLGYYLIAHKRNPMVTMVIVAAAINAVLVVVLTRWLGIAGAALAQACVFGIVIIPWHVRLWLNARRTWHSVDLNHALDTVRPVAL